MSTLKKFRKTPKPGKTMVTIYHRYTTALPGIPYSSHPASSLSVVKYLVLDLAESSKLTRNGTEQVTTC